MRGLDSGMKTARAAQRCDVYRALGIEKGGIEIARSTGMAFFTYESGYCLP